MCAYIGENQAGIFSGKGFTRNRRKRDDGEEEKQNRQDAEQAILVVIDGNGTSVLVMGKW